MGLFWRLRRGIEESWMGYINGTARSQVMLFPEVVEDYIEETNTVRAVAAFVEYLDFRELEFNRAEPAETGRPGYDPRMLLGVYIWGHLNGVRSSRRLERECRRNVELMWLTGKLFPDFKTIANFRKNNGSALKQVFVAFRVWCDGEGLHGKELAAVDGSKFKAVNSMGRNYTKERLRKLIEREEEKVEKYLQDLAENDEREGEEEEPKLSAEELQKKIKGLKERLQKHKQLQLKLAQSGESQISLTDPEARLMRMSKGTDVCYNLQTAVDSQHKLIVAVGVTNACADQGQLAQIAKAAKTALGVSELTVVGDGGYFEGNSLKECEEAGITTYVPVEEKDGATANGIFPRRQFQYDEQQDSYLCPAGAELKVLTKYARKRKQGTDIKIYGTSACSGCALRKQCTTSKSGRKIERWIHQGVIDRQRARNRQQPTVLKQRGSLIEHVFGTLKRAMGHTYFLTKGKEKVSTEASLMALSYNFKRVLTIMETERMIASFALKAS
jgi:transposase